MGDDIGVKLRGRQVLSVYFFQAEDGIRDIGVTGVQTCALPILTGHVAQAARLADVNYFDLTEDVATTRMVKELAEGASTAFIPQCGLAPGFISIVAHDIASHLDRKSTRLNSSHANISYAVFCLK